MSTVEQRCGLRPHCICPSRQDASRLAVQLAVVPLQCRIVHYRGKYRHYSGNRCYSAYCHYPCSTYAEGLHMHCRGQPALLNRHYRGTTTVAATDSSISGRFGACARDQKNKERASCCQRAAYVTVPRIDAVGTCRGKQNAEKKSLTNDHSTDHAK